ncbi:unnamed protein product, partial [Ectocarpus sp. 12 AP-2014]
VRYTARKVRSFLTYIFAIEVNPLFLRVRVAARHYRHQRHTRRLDLFVFLLLRLVTVGILSSIINFPAYLNHNTLFPDALTAITIVDVTVNGVVILERAPYPYFHLGTRFEAITPRSCEGV